MSDPLYRAHGLFYHFFPICSIHLIFRREKDILSKRKKLLNRKEKIFLTHYLVISFISLVLQAIWQRKMLLICGGTLPSVSLILAAWMMGSPVGSSLILKYRDRIRRPENLFLVLQVILFCIAIIYTFTLDALMGINSAFITKILCFMLILFPATFLGMSFPLLGKIFSLGNIPLLYGYGTFVSAFAIVIANFFLIYHLGIRMTSHAVSFTGLIYFTFFLFLSMRRKTGEGPKGFERGRLTRWRKPPLPLFILTFSSGFLTISYEIIYNRLLISFTGNTIYCFTLLTAFYILGLALGSLIYGIMRKRILENTSGFKAFFIALTFCSAWQIFFPVTAFHVNSLLVALKSAFGNNTFAGLFSSRILAPFLLIVPPVSACGFLFPLQIDIYDIHSPEKDNSRSVGIISLISGFGNMTGCLVTTFILIYFIGVSITLRVLSYFGLIIACFTAFSSPRSFARRKTVYFIVIFLILAGSFFIKPVDHIGRMAAREYKTNEILLYKEGLLGTVSVTRNKENKKMLKINSVGEVPTDYNSLRVFKGLAYVPFLLNPDASEILCIAFGGGITFGTLCNIPGTNPVCIEIVKDVLLAAEHFKEYNFSVHVNCRDKILIDDGRSYVHNSKRDFDVIISDSTHPNSCDSWVLYTRDFYCSCSEHLHSNGKMIQWLPFHGISRKDFRVILRTFHSVFPFCELYFFNEYMLMAGSMQPFEIDRKGWTRLIAKKSVSDDLMKYNLDSPEHFGKLSILDQNTFPAFCGPGPISLDDKTPLQYCEVSHLKDNCGRAGILKDILAADKGMALYGKTTLEYHINKLQADYFRAFLFLESSMNDLKDEGSWDSELEYQMKDITALLGEWFQTKEGAAYLLNNRFPGKEEIVLKLLNFMPENRTVITALIYNYLITGSIDKALYHAEKMYRDAPSEYTARIFALILVRAGQKEKATNIRLKWNLSPE